MARGDNTRKVDWSSLPVSIWDNSNRALSKELGVSRATVAVARKRHAPEAVSRYQGMKLGKVTECTNARGETVLTWRHHLPDRKAWLEALPKLLEPLEGAFAPVRAPRVRRRGLVVLPVGDPHVGLLVRRDGEVVWDLEEAVRAHLAAARELFARAPRTERIVIALMGDNTHQNDRTNRTPRSGHTLDVAASTHETVLTAIRLFLDVVDLARKRYPSVDVMVLPGNHDPDATIALTGALWAGYRRCKRVRVDRREGALRSYLYGRSLLCFEHGHTKKLAALNGVATAKWRQLVGQTDRCHWYTGHLHSDQVHSFADGSTAESLEVLAPLDRYADDHGYAERRSARIDTWDPVEGLIDRKWHRVTPPTPKRWKEPEPGW